MRRPVPEERDTRADLTSIGVRVRLLASLVALCAGIAAVVVAILLVKGVLA